MVIKSTVTMHQGSYCPASYSHRLFKYIRSSIGKYKMNAFYTIEDFCGFYSTPIHPPERLRKIIT